MSYDLIEVSRDDARPVELYHFAYTNNVFAYNTSRLDIEHLTVDYTPMPIERGEIDRTGEIKKANLDITVPRTAPIAEVFRVSPPSEVVSVTVFEQHLGDAGYLVIWKGRVMNAEWQNDGSLVLTVDNIFASLSRPGLRRRCQPNCPFALYDNECGVDRDVWKVETVATSISGTNVTVASEIGEPVNWYAGGYMTWVHSVNGNTEKRMIQTSVTATGVMSLLGTPPGLSPGQAVTLYPGCDHTLEGANGCVLKFDNYLMYGGPFHMPRKNPFTSTIF